MQAAHAQTQYPLSAAWAVAGHSQSGFAALAAAEQWGYQLASAAFTNAYNGLMLAHGLQAQQPDLMLENMLDPAALPLAELALDDADCSQVGQSLGERLQAQFDANGRLDALPGIRRDLLTQPGMLPLLQRNSPGQRRLSVPVLLIQSTEDTQTPIGAARALVTRMQAQGTTLSYVEIEGGNHDTTYDERRDEVMAFLREHLTQPVGAGN